MADCRFMMRARGPKNGLDELVMRMTRWEHVPRVHRPVRDLAVIIVGVERVDGGEDVMTYVIDGTCSCSIQGALDSDEDRVGIRSIGWGGTLGWVSGGRRDGETTLGACATELAVDIEAYSYDPNDDVTVWEHAWYSADGTVSLYEDNERYDEWGALLDPVEIPRVWHV